MNSWNPQLAIERSEHDQHWCLKVRPGTLRVAAADGRTPDIDGFIDEIRKLAATAARLNR